jgi:hypothetical protein
MDKAALKALNGSIAKWRRIVAGTGVDEGGTNCPLCKLFNYGRKTGCEGCPVRDRTKLAWCYGTPYREWMSTEAAQMSAPVTTARERALAQKELDFLISLRPTKAA